MKNNHRLLLAAVIASSFSAIDVKGDIFTTCGVDLGMAGRTKNWAAFTLEADPKGKKDKGPWKDELDGGAKVIGDFGADGNGDIKIHGHAMIQGNVYIHTGGKVDKADKGRVTGTVFQNAATDDLLEQASIDALAASNFAAHLPTSHQFISRTNIMLHDHQTLTLTGDGCTVLSLKNFKLDGDSILTLTGTTGTAFVINVTNEFKLTGNSQIKLAGGLTAADVLFNIKGTGGPKVELSGKSMVRGIILAARRDFHMSGSSMVFGEVIANTIKMDGSAKITGAISPSTNP
jgi:choice-of-anchor A domain-containing protein